MLRRIVSGADRERRSDHKQLYFPDTNVLITRFLDADGVCEVQDFMPIQPGSAARQRHRLIRRVLGVRGTLRLRMECAPAFDYGREAHETVIGEHGATFHTRELTLSLASPVPAPAGRAGRARRFLAVGRRDRDLHARARHPRPPPRHCHRARGDRRGVRGHAGLLAPLARDLGLPWTLAGDGPPLGAGAQAAHLCPDRSDRRRPDRRIARGHRRRAQLGLPLHLGARRGVFGARAAAAGLHRGGVGLHGLPRGPRQGDAWRAERPTADHVRDRRPPRDPRAHARPSRGLPLVEAGADRQRRRRTTPARHLRRAARFGVPVQPRRPTDLLRPLERDATARRLARRATGSDPTRGSGRCAAGASSSFTPS